MDRYDESINNSIKKSTKGKKIPYRVTKKEKAESLARIKKNLLVMSMIGAAFVAGVNYENIKDAAYNMIEAGANAAIDVLESNDAQNEAELIAEFEKYGTPWTRDETGRVVPMIAMENDLGENSHGQRN